VDQKVKFCGIFRDKFGENGRFHRNFLRISMANLNKTKKIKKSVKVANFAGIFGANYAGKQ